MVKINKTVFVDCISNFEISSQINIDTTAEILKEYPAFSSMQLLHAVVLNNKSEILFDKKLTDIAVKVRDRTILHDIIHKNKFSIIPEKTKETTKIEVSKKITEVSQTLKEDVIDNTTKQVSKVAKKSLETKKPKEVLSVEKPSVLSNKIQTKSDTIEIPIEKDTNSDNRNKALNDLSKELFSQKIGKDSENLSDKEKRRIEAMKKLQEELFAPKPFKATTKKVTKPTVVAKPTDIKKEKIFETKSITEKTTPVNIEQVAKTTPTILVKIEPIKEKILLDDKKPNFSDKINALQGKIKSETQKEAIPKQETTNSRSSITQSVKDIIDKELKISSKNKEFSNSKKDFNEKNIIHTKQVSDSKPTGLSDKLKALQVKLKADKLNNSDFKKKTKSTTEPLVPKIVKTNSNQKSNDLTLQESKNSFQAKIEILKAKLKANKEKEATEAKAKKEDLKTFIPVSKNIEPEKTTKSLIPKIDKESTSKNKTSVTKTPSSVKKSTGNVSKLNFLDWLKEKNTETSLQQTIAKVDDSKKKFPINTHNKPSEAIKEIIVKSKPITTTKKVIKDESIPFDRVSTIEVEMHKEIKTSQDPLDTFISSQIAKKKIVKIKTTKTVVQKEMGLVSETLAEIMVLQQKYEAAIEVYNTLSIKYPQKSIYFATQIKKIKTYL